MNITNKEITNSVDPLNKLIGMKWPVKTSLQVAKLANKLEEPLSEINIVKKGLLKTYDISLESDDDGNTTINSKVEGNVLKYVTEFNELASLETEIDVDKIKLPAEVDGKALEIEPSILIALEKFIEVE